MPLPWRSKYLIKYIYTPCWTQQLGVFALNNFDSKLVNQFVKAIPKKFLKTSIQFNSHCSLLKPTEIKNNYILPLNKPYHELFVKFSKNRKRVLKKVITEDIQIYQNDLTSFLECYKHRNVSFKTSNEDLNKLILLINTLLKKSLGTLTTVTIDNKTMATVFVTNYKNRITYLAPFSTLIGKQKNLPTLLITEILKTYNLKNYTLDFEGSMIDGVAKFYKSFGSEIETYEVYNKSVFCFLK